MSRINIFGSSETLEEREKEIRRILSLKSSSIGINQFPIKYPNVDYWIFSDEHTIKEIINLNAYKGQRIITNRYIYNKYAKVLDWKFENPFEPNHIPDHIANSGWFAIWWAIVRGYTDMHLYGVLDGKYTRKPNGDMIFKNIFKGDHIMKGKDYTKFISHIESGFNKRIKICQPLKSMDAQIKFLN